MVDSTMRSYVGSLEVEDDGFILHVDRLICREEELAFEFTGRDEWGVFHIQGIAKLTENGFYMAPHVKLIYDNYVKNDDVASIKFTDAILNLDVCIIRGLWIQNGDEWAISGELRQFNSK